ncbi:hypothetical protein FRC18_010293 [Serendipita sp. 400]|nr:hypothetical protein FRC18_010293 [Serendipita sp. 400]
MSHQTRHGATAFDASDAAPPPLDLGPQPTSRDEKESLSSDKHQPVTPQVLAIEKPVKNGSTPPKRSRLKSITIVAAAAGTMTLNVSSMTAVSMAIPTIARDLEIANDKIPWIVSAFTLSAGCLLLLFGRLADLYGRKLVWRLGALWIVIISFACSFAKTGTQLIILRAMHGMGPAAMVPAALGILAHSFPPSRARSTAFATFSAGAPIGGAIGTVYGGIMANYASWRGVFYFTAALGAVVLLAGHFAMDPDTHNVSTDRRVDWIGAFLVTSGLVLFTFALGDAPTVGWSSPRTIALLVSGPILVVIFLLWEHHLIAHTSFPPLMPLNIWTRANGRFAAMIGVAFMEWACFTTLTLWATLYYQNYQRLNPMQTMLRFLPMPVTGVICNVVVALTVGAINGAYLLALGTTATSLSALLFALINPTASYFAFGFPASVICVMGADFVFACGTLFIAKVALPGEQSVAGALFQTVTSLGTSFGLAITTIAEVAGASHEAGRMGIHVSLDAPVSTIPPPVLLNGYRMAQFASFAFGITGFLMVLMFLHGIGIVGTKRTKQVTGPEEARPTKEGPA